MSISIESTLMLMLCWKIWHMQFSLKWQNSSHEGQQGEWRYSCTLSLTLVLDGVDGRCHTPATFLLGKIPGPHCVGGWVGPRASVEGCRKSRPHWDLIPGPPAPSELLYWLCCHANTKFSWVKLSNIWFNLLKTKRNPHYIRNQSVPCCKHFPPRL